MAEEKDITGVRTRFRHRCGAGIHSERSGRRHHQAHFREKGGAAVAAGFPPRCFPQMAENEDAEVGASGHT